MGLKKSNYEVKNLGITIPEAHAMIRNIIIDGERGVAKFVIQSSRDNAKNLKPLETVNVHFAVDRNESPYITAYKEAKAEKEVFGLEGLEKIPAIFDGWEDDIIDK